MTRLSWTALLLFIFYSQASSSALPEQACLIEQLKTADDNATIGDLKALCQTLRPVSEVPSETATQVIEAEAATTPSGTGPTHST